MVLHLTDVDDGRVLAELSEGKYIVGQDADCDICIDDESVSRRHAEVAFVEGRWHVTDLGSTNGSTVDGTVVAGTTPFDDGSTVGFGLFAFRAAFPARSNVIQLKTQGSPGSKGRAMKWCGAALLLLTVVGLVLLWDIKRPKKVERSDGSIYVGQMMFGVPHGRGKLAYGNGDRFVGTFHHGDPDGEGIYTYSSGDRCEGTWRAGEKVSPSKLYSRNGDVYEGALVADRPHGEGTRRYADGRTYTGFWKEGVLHGKGKFEWGGGFYEGQFADGKYHGQGVQVYADGGKRVGTWKDGDLLPGYTYYWENGNHYTGDWDGDGFCHGQGTMFYPEGGWFMKCTRYEGGWHHGKWHGGGVVSLPDGRNYSATWAEGKLLVPDYRFEATQVFDIMHTVVQEGVSEKGNMGKWHRMVLRLQQMDVSRCPKEIQTKWYELTAAMMSVYTTNKNQATFGEAVVAGFVDGLNGGPGANVRSLYERREDSQKAVRNMQGLLREMDLLFLKHIK